MKKVFVHEVKLPPPHALVCVDIYAESDAGYWSATVGENRFESKDIREVKDWITKLVKNGVPDPVEYVPFIEIGRVREETSYGARSETRASLIFDYNVLFLSKEVYEETVRGETKRFRRKRKAIVEADMMVYRDPDEPDEDGSHRWEKRRDENSEEDGRRYAAIVPYTAQRYQALLTLTGRLNELRERLDALLVQSGDAAEALDRVEVLGLLGPLPETTKQKARRAR